MKAYLVCSDIGEEVELDVVQPDVEDETLVIKTLCLGEDALALLAEKWAESNNYPGRFWIRIIM